MKHPFLHLSATLCLTLAAAFTLTGCREDAIIKSSLTPAVDNIHTFGIGPDFNNGSDTITILTRTVYEDSVVTSTREPNFPTYHALGWVTDPFAGTTSGSIYMQVVPTAVGFKIPTTAVVDELVLVLPYSGFTWGDTTMTATRTVNVYRVTDSFSKDATYYNFSTRTTDNTLIGTATLQTGRAGTGSIQDSVDVLGKKRAPHLRIRLTSAFKDIFLAALASDTSYSSFTNVMRGFYIVPDTTGTGTAMPYLRLDGSADFYGSAAVIAYGHTSGKTDTLEFQFPYDERYAAHFNRITRNYSGTEAGKLLQPGDSTLVAMQNGPGAVIDVRLPYIQNLPKDLNIQSMIINKAELVFTKVPTVSDDKFFGPVRLYPRGVNSSGGRYDIADFYPVSAATVNFVDGTPRSAVKGGLTVEEYRINIPREVQKAIIQESDGLHLRIGGTVNFPAAYRLVVGGHGNQNPIYRPSINIIYSKQ